MKHKKGFTLIELLVVIAIISVISSVVLSSLSQARAKAKITSRIQQLKQIQTALEVYYTKHGQYPPSVSPTGWGDSLSMWVIDCSVQPSVSNPSGFIIPELISDGVFSGLKDQTFNDCDNETYDGYSYGSNGKDYKLLVRNQSNVNANIKMVDPATDNPAEDDPGGPLGDFCAVDGTNHRFYGVWTPGASCWLERWRCDQELYCLSSDGVTYN